MQLLQPHSFISGSVTESAFYDKENDIGTVQRGIGRRRSGPSGWHALVLMESPRESTLSISVRSILIISHHTLRRHHQGPHRLGPLYPFGLPARPDRMPLLPTALVFLTYPASETKINSGPPVTEPHVEEL